MKKFKITFVIGITLVGLLLSLWIVSRSNACGNGCGDISPTINPCIGNIHFQDEYEYDCITPTATPTATPSATPTPTSTETPPVIFGSGSTTQSPSAPVCNIPFAAPVLTSITAGGSGTLLVNWMESESDIDKFSIVFGLVNQSMNMGRDNIPGNPSGAGILRSLSISDLPIGASINAQVWAFKNGCAEKSGILDPIVL